MQPLQDAVMYILTESVDRVLSIISVTFINIFVAMFVWAAYTYTIAPTFGWMPIPWFVFWLGLTSVDFITRTIAH